MMRLMSAAFVAFFLCFSATAKTREAAQLSGLMDISLAHQGQKQAGLFIFEINRAFIQLPTPQSQRSELLELKYLHSFWLEQTARFLISECATVTREEEFN